MIGDLFVVIFQQAILNFFTDNGNPSFLKGLKGTFPQYFFHGDAHIGSVQVSIKDAFIDLLHGPFFPPDFCSDDPQCNASNVDVFVGESGEKYITALILSEVSTLISHK